MLEILSKISVNWFLIENKMSFLINPNILWSLIYFRIYVVKNNLIIY